MTKKRTICILLVLMLLIGCAASSTSVADVPQVCRSVRVKLTTAEKKSISFTVVGTYYIAESPNFDIVPGSCTVAVSGSSLKITNGGQSLVVGPKITLVRYADARLDTSYLRIPNTRYNTNLNYLGNMIFVRASSSSVRVINEVNIEEYLYGLVPYEMSDSYPLEALKAQAVCGRGYVVAAVLKKPNAAYHIGDTSSDQVYRGFDASKVNAIAAVQATKGLVMTYGGSIITSYYAASNGGQTELTGNAWSSNMPYYVHKDDPFDVANPYSRQELSFIPAEYTDANKKLMHKDVLNMIQNLADDEAGKTVQLLQTLAVAPNTPKYTDDPDSRCFTKVDIRLQVLREGDEAPTEITIVIVLDDLITDETDNSATKYKNAPFHSELSLRMRGAEVSTVEGQTGWQLTNRRYGHGVGMSQRGAQQRAAEGQLFDEILAFYYDSTTLTTIDTAPALQPDRPINKVYPARALSGGAKVLYGPDASFDKLGSVAAGELILITYKNYFSTWHQAVSGGKLGYVDSHYVELLADTAYETPGWIRLSDASYYLDAAGTPHTGIREVDGSTYFFNRSGKMQTGLILSGADLYYANESGVLQTGTHTINGFEYTFDAATYACPAANFVTLTSNSYAVDREKLTVKGVARETTVEAFLAGFMNPRGTLRVVGVDGKAVSASAFVGTGMHVQTVLSDAVVDDMVITIRGDASGDGYIDVADILVIQTHILDIKPLTDSNVFAMADINGDSYADVNDILLIVSDILGKSEIEP